MKIILKSKLKVIVKELTRLVRKLSKVYQTTTTGWEKTGDQSWQTLDKDIGDIRTIIQEIEKSGLFNSYLEFTNDFFEEYIEFQKPIRIFGMFSEDIYANKNILYKNIILYIHRKLITIGKVNIDKFLEELERFFDTRELNLLFQAELLGFQSEVKESILDNSLNLKIRKLSNVEISRNRESHFHGNNANPINEYCLEYGLKLKYNDDNKQKLYIMQNPEEVFNNVIKAMNIFSDGSVNIRSVSTFIDGFGFFYNGMESGMAVEGIYGDMTLTKSSINKFKKFYKENNPFHKSIELAVDRLTFAKNRIKPIDAIIDAVIGLESLLIGSKEDELRFKFSLRYSLLYSKDKRDYFFKHAKKVYDLRSTIVHGNKLKNIDEIDLGDGKKYNIYEAAKIIKDDLRYVLKTIINKGLSDKLSSENWESLYFGN